MHAVGCGGLLLPLLLCVWLSRDVLNMEHDTLNDVGRSFLSYLGARQPAPCQDYLVWKGYALS